MITLHHLRCAGPFVVNSDLIEVVESTPDTHITLTTGKKLIVRETPAEVIALVVEFRRLTGSALPRVVAHASSV
jgi:flagellar protein FlbD